MASKVALQGSLFAILGMGAYAMRRLLHEPLHPLVMQYTSVVARQPSLAGCVSRLSVLNDLDGLDAILHRLSEIVDLDASPSPAAQWQISRKSGEVVQEAREMCRRVSAATSEEMFRAVLTCTDEVVPQLEGHLQNLLHNHLLSR